MPNALLGQLKAAAHLYERIYGVAHQKYDRKMLYAVCHVAQLQSIEQSQ
jgi:hypothetical protein